MRRIHGLIVLVAVSTGCGGSTARAPATSYVVQAESYGGADYGGGDAPTAMLMATEASSDDYEYEESAPPMRQAQAAPPPPAEEADIADTDPAQGDAGSPMLVYEAHIVMAVFEVRDRQEHLVESIRGMSGFIGSQTSTSLVLRVPTARFDEAIAMIEASGDVIDKSLSTTDVGDNFRDLTIRIRNAEAMRGRLEELLSRATDVNQAVMVERELERVTLLVEQLKGQLEALSDRVAFSTIHVMFQVRAPQAVGNGTFRLPFPWLEDLGLPTLLTL